MSDNKIVQFYSERLDKPGIYEKFANIISRSADDVENAEEEKRQEIIMSDMMYAFDTVCMEGEKHRYASAKFRDALIDDELTDWQLKMIKGVCHDHYPNVAKSCDTIITEGC